MATARPGDHLSLFHWPADDVVIRDLGGTAVTAEITSITAVTDPALLSAAGKVSQVVRNASVGAWTAECALALLDGAAGSGGRSARARAVCRPR